VTFGLPAQDAHTELLDRMIALIPSGASVFTTEHLFPQLSDRIDAYTLPDVQFFSGNLNFSDWANTFIDQSDYILLDFTIDPTPSGFILGTGNFSDFGVLAAGGGILLLERGWTAPPLAGFWSGSSWTASGASVGENGAVAVASNQSLAFAQNASHDGKVFLNGPGINRVTPGEYVATIDYRLWSGTNASAFRLQLRQMPVYVNQTVFITEPSGTYYNVTFSHWNESTSVAASVNVTPTAAQVGKWIAGSASVEFDVTNLSDLTPVAISTGAPFSIYVSSVTLSLVGAPVALFPTPVPPGSGGTT
jgi:hypothetical protein